MSVKIAHKPLITVLCEELYVRDPFNCHAEWINSFGFDKKAAQHVVIPMIRYMCLIDKTHSSPLHISHLVQNRMSYCQQLVR